MKPYTKCDINKAVQEIKDSERTVAQASKRYKIPETTLRSRLKSALNRTKKKYSVEDAGKAMVDIENKILSVAAASKKYNIPRTSLMNRLKGVHTKAYGSSTVLSNEQEQHLAKWIILCAQSGYPKTKTQILRTAAELSNLNPEHFLKSKPTTGWFQKFQQRHPNISDRKPEPLGKASASITSEGLKNFFDLIKSQFDESDRSDLLYKPQSWWNVDETSFEMNPTPRKVYAKKGAKTVHIIERGKPKENITCTYAVCADGRSIPPLITFKETFSNLDLAAYVSKDIGGNFGFNHTESGWMKGDAFFFFITEHLYPRWVAMGENFPIVLVIDGYSAHKSTKLFIWCKEHEIILVLLYPNSTHMLQVLDIAIFSPLKMKYTEFHELWKELHANENFTELEFLKVIKATNDEVLKPTTIINGWRATGLQPFNFDNIKLDILVTNSDDGLHQNDQSLQEDSVSLITVPSEKEIVNDQVVNNVGNEVILELNDDYPVQFPDVIDIDAYGNDPILQEDSVPLITVISDTEIVNTQVNVCNEVIFKLNDDGPAEFVDVIDKVTNINDPLEHSDDSTFGPIDEENSNTSSTTNERESKLNDENTDSNDSTSFASLNKHINLFANDLDGEYADTDFLLDGNLLPDSQSTTSDAAAKQIKKLVEKTRENLRQLGILVKVHDPPKMLNVLVMAQQLLIIDPVPPTVEIEAPKTMMDILKIPTTARTKRVRNKKLSFGIMSDTEIVHTVDELVINEKHTEKLNESDKLLATQITKEIESLENAIKEEQAGMQQKKNELKVLKERKATEKKESVKRKRDNAITKKKSNEKQLKAAPGASEIQNLPQSSGYIRKKAKK